MLTQLDAMDAAKATEVAAWCKVRMEGEKNAGAIVGDALERLPAERGEHQPQAARQDGKPAIAAK